MTAELLIKKASLSSPVKEFSYSEESDEDNLQTLSARLFN